MILQSRPWGGGIVTLTQHTLNCHRLVWPTTPKGWGHYDMFFLFFMYIRVLIMLDDYGGMYCQAVIWRERIGSNFLSAGPSLIITHRNFQWAGGGCGMEGYLDHTQLTNCSHLISW